VEIVEDVLLSSGVGGEDRMAAIDIDFYAVLFLTPCRLCVPCV
jgi:hypothetical protein